MPSLTYVKGLPTPINELNALGCTDFEMFLEANYTKEDLEQTGIYAIVNRKTNKFYIGSASRSFRHRWYGHKFQLKHNKHHSTYLQNAWNKYSASMFAFLILEVVPKHEWADNNYLVSVEQIWLDAFRPAYNTSPTAGSCLGLKLKEETKQKLSRVHKGRKHTEEQKINGAKARAKKFEIISPFGEIVSGSNIANFCRTNNLDLGAICSVLRGDSFSYKNWTKNKENHLKLNQCGTIKAKTFSRLIDQNGIIYSVYNQSAFAREYNLNPSHVSAVLRGKMAQVKGFKLYLED